MDGRLFLLTESDLDDKLQKYSLQLIHQGQAVGCVCVCVCVCVCARVHVYVCLGRRYVLFWSLSVISYYWSFGGAGR